MAEKRNEITDIEVQKKNKNRVSIYLDDRYAFGLDIMTAATLSRGESLSSDRIEELKEKDEYSRAINSATRFLGSRARSCKEMRVYLKGKEISGPVIRRVIDKLTEGNYLDDSEFARLWVDSRRRFNPKGIWTLRQELKQKGVGETDIEDALSEYDESLAAWTAVEKKLSHWKRLETDQLKKKAFTFLSSRGFSWETTEETYKKIVFKLEEMEKDGTSV